MFTDKEIIGKVRKLSQVKPRKDWVFLTKKEILGETSSFGFFPYLTRNKILSFAQMSYFKPALAGFVVVFVFLGILGFAKNSLPGEPLYFVRKVAHFGQTILASQNEKPGVQLELANDRLQDLTKASPKNLAPTINEFQANISQAARELTRMDMTTSSPAVIKKIVEETKKLQENKQKVESLGVVIDGTQELDDALAKITTDLIEDLKESTLIEEKEDILGKMEELYEGKRYSEALELYFEDNKKAIDYRSIQEVVLGETRVHA